MQRCTASLLSVVMPPKVNLALRAENYPSWRGNIEEGHAETLGSLQKNPKVKDGERAILYSSWRKSIARMGFSWTYHVQSCFRGSAGEVFTFLPIFLFSPGMDLGTSLNFDSSLFERILLIQCLGDPPGSSLLCLSAGITQVGISAGITAGMAQVDLASALNAVNYECPLTCFIPEGSWGWSPRGFSGPSLDDKIGVIPCETGRLHLLYTLL